MLLMANAGVVTATYDAAPETLARLVAYMIQAFSGYWCEDGWVEAVTDNYI
jgi:hypothetical protein